MPQRRTSPSWARRSVEAAAANPARPRAFALALFALAILTALGGYLSTLGQDSPWRAALTWLLLAALLVVLGMSQTLLAAAGELLAAKAPPQE